MVDVIVDPALDDRERSRRLYAGDIVVYTDVPAVADFARFTRGLISDVFDLDDPTEVHATLGPAELAEILIEFKPRFIHHPESIDHVRRIATALGCDPAAVHADVPRLRTVFPRGHLDTGIAYAFQPHRDTWYAAPLQQINWWLPVWGASPDNAVEFFPRAFGAVVDNNSDEYDYELAAEWRGRIRDFSGGTDARVHPAPRPPLPLDEPRQCVLPPFGGIMMFSADQLHATIPNSSGVSRFSVDFRTVHAADVRSGTGAPSVDVRCSGSALGDFRRLSDGAPFSAEELARHERRWAGATG